MSSFLTVQYSLRNWFCHSVMAHSTAVSYSSKGSDTMEQVPSCWRRCSLSPSSTGSEFKVQQLVWVQHAERFPAAFLWTDVYVLSHLPTSLPESKFSSSDGHLKWRRGDCSSGWEPAESDSPASVCECHISIVHLLVRIDSLQPHISPEP